MSAVPRAVPAMLAVGTVGTLVAAAAGLAPAASGQAVTNGASPPANTAVARATARGTAPLGAGPSAARVPRAPTLTLAFVGDVLVHDTLLIQAAEAPSGSVSGFATLWQQVAPALAAADLTWANLEVPTAEGVRCDRRISERPPPVTLANGTCGTGNGEAVYTGYPFFNSPPELLDALVEAGVDVVSTANNHALDRGRVGLLRTIEALDARGLAFAGTGAEPGSEPPHATTPARLGASPVRIGWLACTYGTNGLVDGADLVAHCYDDRSAPSPELLAAVRGLAADPTLDAVIVTPHWGVEYQHVPSPAQEALASELVAAGATAVVGTHPHVVQPVRSVAAGNRSAPVAFSLGNFVSDQPEPAMRTGLLLYLDLVRGGDGRLHARNPRYVPLFAAHAPDAGGHRRTLVVLDDDVPGAAAAAAREVVRDVLDPDLRSGPLAGPESPARATAALGPARDPHRRPSHPR